MRIERKVNFSDITERAILQQELSEAKGFHHVEISPARKGATTPQHRYYRGVVVPLAKAWLNESQGEQYGDTETHEWLKLHFRGKPIVDKTTGEQFGVAAKSHALYSVTEMIEFIDDVVAMLESFGIRVPSPDDARDGRPEAAGEVRAVGGRDV